MTQLFQRKAATPSLLQEKAARSLGEVAGFQKQKVARLRLNFHKRRPAPFIFIKATSIRRNLH